MTTDNKSNTKSNAKVKFRELVPGTKTYMLFKFRRQQKTVHRTELMLYIRLTINGQRGGERSTYIRGNPETFCLATKRFTGSDPESLAANKRLEEIENRLKEIIGNLKQAGLSITHDAVWRCYETGAKTPQEGMTVTEVFNELIEKQRRQVGFGLAISTIQVLETRRNNLIRFFQHQYQKDDLLLMEVKPVIGYDIQVYFKSVLHFSQNYTSKVLQTYKQVFRYAVKSDYLRRNPLDDLRLRFEKNQDIIYLGEYEIKKLENYLFESEALTRTRDFYLFCCYTGLAYTDARHFTEKDITTGSDGKPWIKICRQKTDSLCLVPLLPEALRILEKYRHDRDCIKNDRLLPKFSNQILNRNLKQMAAMAGIDKPLHCHSGRKTFAMRMLNAGVPIESVSRMLGHSSIKQTQGTYAHVLDHKIAEDMDAYLKKRGRTTVQSDAPANGPFVSIVRNLA